MSEDIQRKIDEETRKIIDQCYGKAAKMLEDNRDILESMTQALMKYETIDSGQIDELMDRKPVSAPEGWQESDSRAARDEAAKAKDKDQEDFDLDEKDLNDDDNDGADSDTPDQNIH